MDKRLVFDTIPELFDKWRPRYCAEAFSDIIESAALSNTSRMLEIGPGTGQATEPFLRSGCAYLAIELGANFTGVMRDKFGSYPNFDIVNADFETHDFGGAQFDLIFSAAAIQWIPEEIGFGRSYELLRPGGMLAMMVCKGEYKTPNEALYERIQEVYAEFFKPEQPYRCNLEYENTVNYGFAANVVREYPSRRVYNADDYVELIKTHSDHITLGEPYRAKFFEGIRKSILDFGDEIVINDTIVVRSAVKL